MQSKPTIMANAGRIGIRGSRYRKTMRMDKFACRINKCSIMLRRSDDGPDSISNLAGNFNCGKVMGKKVPKGFLG